MDYLNDNPTILAALVGAFVSSVLTILGWLVTKFGGVIWNVSAWKTGVDNTLEYLKDAIKRLEIRIETILQRLPRSVNPAMIEGHSPLQLTELGKQISTDIDAERIAERYLLALTEAYRSMNQYEIQEACFDYAATQIMPDLKAHDPEKAKALALYAFNTGKMLDELLQIIGIVLRNKVCKKLGISI